jgi:hypothetical protein
MKKIGFIPIILLAVTLLALLVLFTQKMISTRSQQEAIMRTNTAVMMTLDARNTEAAKPTVTPLPSETPTPEPSATSTLIEVILPDTPTAKPKEVIEGCDVAAFLWDVNFPDGTELDPDTKFTKTWKILNDGKCTWNSSYKLYFVEGNKMSGPTSQSLTSVDVPPGASIDVSVELRAPKEPGVYQGYWGFKDPGGAEFGVGEKNVPIYVEIKVVGP